MTAANTATRKPEVKLIWEHIRTYFPGMADEVGWWPYTVLSYYAQCVRAPRAEACVRILERALDLYREKSQSEAVLADLPAIELSDGLPVRMMIAGREVTFSPDDAQAYEHTLFDFIESIPGRVQRVVVGYRYWPPGTCCGQCGSTYIALERTDDAEIYLARCWSGHILRAGADHPTVSAMLVTLATERK